MKSFDKDMHGRNLGDEQRRTVDVLKTVVYSRFVSKANPTLTLTLSHNANPNTNTNPNLNPDEFICGTSWLPPKHAGFNESVNTGR